MFDYFDKIYCINLDSRPDRWKQAQKEFDKVGILDRVERFSAMTSKNEGGPQGKNVRGKLKWKNLDGTIMSHMTCIKNAKDNGWKNVLIFEDDVYFDGYDSDKLSKSLELLKSRKWNLFFLGGNIIDLDVGWQKFEKLSNDLYEVNLPIYAIHAYAVNHTAYRRILRNHYLKVDWELNDITSHHRRVWSMDKYLGDKIDKKHTIGTPVCFQREGHSDINNEVIEQTKNSLVSYSSVLGTPIFADRRRERWMKSGSPPWYVKNFAHWLLWHYEDGNIIYPRDFKRPKKSKVVLVERQTRVLLNHMEVEKTLRKYCEANNMDFVNIDTATIPVDEQIDLFKDATTIIGVHGAGLANCFWMPPKSAYCEFSIEHWPLIKGKNHHEGMIWNERLVKDKFHVTRFLCEKEKSEQYYVESRNRRITEWRDWNLYVDIDRFEKQLGEIVV